MLPQWEETRTALRGLTLLVVNDPEAPLDPRRYFQTDADAFFRSFGVFVYALPLLLVMATADWQMKILQGDTSTPHVFYVGLWIVLKGLTWLLFAGLVGVLAKHLKIQRDYAPYIIMQNWASFGAILVTFPLYGLYMIGMVDMPALLLFSFILNIALLVFYWRVALVALQCDGITAAELVIIRLAVGFAMGWVATAALITNS